MKKIRSIFGNIKYKNIIFVLSLILCAGVISYAAFASDIYNNKAVGVADSNDTSSSETMTWYKAGPDAYELNSEITSYEKTSKTTVKKSSASVSKKTVTADKKQKTSASEVKTAAGKLQVSKKTTAKTTVKKVKNTAKKTVSTTTVKKTKKKKKTKKAVSAVTTTTTKVTKAYSPPKSVSKTYKTRDISDETYKIKCISNGKKIKSDGFDILCQIVNGEIGSSWNEEAIKAQAVAAYTYLRYCREKSITPVLAAKSGYDSRLERIVKSVEGLTCTYNGEIIDAVFCASTAGCSADALNVWGGNYPYLRSVDSKYDEAYDPNYGVTKTMSKAEVKKILEKKGVKLSTKKKNWIKVTSNYNGKYVGNVSIDGQVTLTGTEIRSLMELKSAAFTVKYSDGNFIFTTYGYGHGVGMSQWGAQLYASKGGYKFDQILKHYYRGIKITLSQEIN